MHTLHVEQKNGICHIRFYQHTVDAEMIREFELAMDQLSNQKDLKAVILYGDQAAFITGGALKDHREKSGQEVYPSLKRMGAVLEKLSQLNAVTIAAVQGQAIGGGCEIITSCDFCIASTSASFQWVQVRLGITTAWGGANRLMRKVGTKQALYHLLLGEPLTAEQAQVSGLVDFVFPEEQFAPELKKFIKKISQSSPSIIQSFKKIARLVDANIPSSALYSIEADDCAVCWDQEKHQKIVKFL